MSGLAILPILSVWNQFIDHGREEHHRYAYDEEARCKKHLGVAGLRAKGWANGCRQGKTCDRQDQPRQQSCQEEKCPVHRQPSYSDAFQRDSEPSDSLTSVMGKTLKNTT